MELQEKYKRNEEKIRKLQEENKELMRKKREQEQKKHLQYLEKQDKILRNHLWEQVEEINPEFLQYAMEKLEENFNLLFEEWNKSVPK